MNRTALKAIISDLDNACFRLQLDLIEHPDEAETIATQFQRVLDTSQQQLDDAREPPKPLALSMQLTHACETGCGNQIRLEYKRCNPCVEYEHLTGRPAPMIHRHGACTACGEFGMLRPDGVCILCKDAAA